MNLKPIYAGEGSVVIGIHKQYNLVSGSKANTLVKAKKIKNVWGPKRTPGTGLEAPAVPLIFEV